MKMGWRSAIFFTVAAVCGSAYASSGTQTNAILRIIPSDPNSFQATGGEIKSSANAFIGTSTASAFADLSTGVLRASVHNGFSGESFAFAGIRDTLTFDSRVTPSTAHLRWSFDGVFTPGTGPFMAYLEITGISVYNHVLSQAASFVVKATPSPVCDATRCIVNAFSSVSDSGVIDVPIAPGTLGLSALLYVEAGDRSSADFGHTARIWLDLPTGVSYTSESGQFLSAVPEPGTFAMALVGLSTLMLVGCRKVRQIQEFTDE